MDVDSDTDASGISEWGERTSQESSEDDVSLAEEPSHTPLTVVDERPDDRPAQRVARAVLRTFTSELRGCGEGKHARQLRKHEREFAAVNRPHGLLKAARKGVRLPDVLQPAEAAMLTTNVRVRAAENMQQLFEGSAESGNDSHAPSICLHEEDQDTGGLQEEFDVDSLMGYPRTLDFCKGGIIFHPVPSRRRVISTTVRHTRREGSETALRVQDCTHFYLGSASRDVKVEIYCILPQVSFHESPFPSRDMCARWYDEILAPAIRDQCGPAVTQHLPQTFAQAEAHSKQPATNNTLQSDGSVVGVNHGFHLQEQDLEQIWHSIQTAIRRPGLQDFAELELFFAVKGVKLQHKKPTLARCITAFKTWLEATFKMRNIDEDDFFVDVARDIVAQRQATSLLWKECCLDAIICQVYGRREGRSDDTEGGRGYFTCQADAQTTFYNIALLRDACNATATPRKSHPLYEGGLRYTQLYTPLRNAFATGQEWPFGSRNLEELALGLGLRQAIATTGGGGRPYSVVKELYGRNKKAFLTSYNGSCRHSHGVRVEHRVSLPVLDSMQDLTRTRYDDQTTPSSAFWAIRTPALFDHMRHNVTKFCMGFDMVAGLANGSHTLEQAKMLLMFLNCLRVCISGVHLPREVALWKYRQRVRRGEVELVRTGLGWEETIKRYGYAWLLPVVDWARLLFHHDEQPTTFFHTTYLVGRYRRRWSEVNDLQSRWLLIGNCGAWLVQYRGVAAKLRIYDLMIYAILAQYRADILSRTEGDHDAGMRKAVASDEVPFSAEGFSQLFQRPPYFVSSSRVLYQDPLSLFTLLFGRSEREHADRTRERFHRIGFRKLYALARHEIREAIGDNTSAELMYFEDRLFKHLAAHHWVYPCPSQGKLFSRSTVHLGRRVQLWSLIKSSPTQSHPFPWAWGGQFTQHGRPKAFPAWSRETLEVMEEEVRHRARGVVVHPD